MSDAHIEFLAREALHDVKSTLYKNYSGTEEANAIAIQKQQLVPLPDKISAETRIAALNRLIDELSEEDILSAVKLFEYTGFDPIEMRKKVAKEGTASAIFFCLATVSQRGTNASKMKNKTTPEGVKKFEQAVKDLSIDTTAKGSNIGPDVVTLGRLAACFPEVTARIFKKYGNSNKFGYSGDLAHYLMFPQAPSIMDKESDYKMWKEWNEKFTKVINPPKKKKKESKDEDESPVTDFGEIIYNSKLFNSDDRKRIMDKLRSDESKIKVRSQAESTPISSDSNVNVEGEKKMLSTITSLETVHLSKEIKDANKSSQVIDEEKAAEVDWIFIFGEPDFEKKSTKDFTRDKNYNNFIYFVNLIRERLEAVCPTDEMIAQMMALWVGIYKRFIVKKVEPTLDLINNIAQLMIDNEPTDSLSYIDERIIELKKAAKVQKQGTPKSVTTGSSSTSDPSKADKQAPSKP